MTTPSGKICNEPEEREKERRRRREKNAIYSGHLRLFQQPRAAHALRSDQYIVYVDKCEEMNTSQTNL